MEELYRYEVEIYKGPFRWGEKENAFIKSTVGIVAENDLFYVMDTKWFSKVCKERDYGDYQLNVPQISIRVNDRFFDNGIFYKLYSDRKKQPRTIQREIREKIQEKMSWMGSDVDLSIIK